MHRSPTPPLACLVLLAGLGAQHVSPADHRLAEGLNNNVFPFGTTIVPFRFAQVHDDVPAMTITGLAFRHDASRATFPAHDVTCDAWMSTAVNSSTLAANAFDANHGRDRLQVIAARTFRHPVSDPRNVPGDWVLAYPFDVPFTFAGTPASLCWEVQVTAKTQSIDVTHDAFSVSVNPPLQIGGGGTSCLATGAAAHMAAAGSSRMDWRAGSGTLTVTASHGPAAAPAVHVLGTDRRRWGTFALPFEVPGSAGAPSGRCYLHTDVLAALPAGFDAAGALTSSTAVPAHQDLHGLAVLSQLCAVDPPANPLGLVTSPLVVHGYVRPTWPTVACRIWAAGNLGPVGTVSASSWLVTRFH